MRNELHLKLVKKANDITYNRLELCHESPANYKLPQIVDLILGIN